MLLNFELFQVLIVYSMVNKSSNELKLKLLVTSKKFDFQAFLLFFIYVSSNKGKIPLSVSADHGIYSGQKKKVNGSGFVN